MRKRKAGSSGGEEPARHAERSVLGDVAGDPGNGTLDVPGQEGQSTENSDRNYGQNDAVLGHGLPFLARLQRGEKLLHLLHLPSRSRAAAGCRRRQRIDGGEGARCFPRATQLLDNAQIAHAELPLVRALAWPRRRWAQLAESSCVENATPIPQPSDCRKAFPYSGERRRLLLPDEWVTFRMRPRNSLEIRADVAASALKERWEHGTCHYGNTACRA